MICFNQENSILFLNPVYHSCFPILTSVDSFKQGRSSVRIFPHPVTGISIIEFDNNGVDIESFELYDMLGQKIKVINIIGHEQITINANDFKPGLYFFRLSGNNMNMVSGKIIIK